MTPDEITADILLLLAWESNTQRCSVSFGLVTACALQRSRAGNRLRRKGGGGYDSGRGRNIAHALF